MYINVNNNNFLIEDIRFAEIYQLTLGVCSLSDLPEGTISITGDKWVDLATAWDALLTNGSAGIFTEAAHRIMWGIPSGGAIVQYEPIVQFVVKELLDDGPAFNSWDQLPSCDMAIGLIVAEMNPWTDDEDEYRYSIEHYHYLSSKMMYKIRYSKGKYVDEASSYTEECRRYETAIKKLVPAAEFWTEADWYKEKNIHDQISKLYDVDYRNDYIDYGRILLLLMDSSDDEKWCMLDEPWLAANIGKMPVSIAQVIWPEDTEMKIMSLFLLAAELTENYVINGRNIDILKIQYIHPFGVFDYAVLYNSWLYATMYTWFSECEEQDEIVKTARKRLFDIAMKCKV